MLPSVLNVVCRPHLRQSDSLDFSPRPEVPEKPPASRLNLFAARSAASVLMSSILSDPQDRNAPQDNSACHRFHIRPYELHSATNGLGRRGRCSNPRNVV